MDTASSSRREQSILIIDDEAMFVESLHQILETQGYLIDTALSGKAALRQLDSAAYDLILLDLIMPEVSGEQVLRHIIDQNLNSAVLVVSGTDSVESATQTLKQGAHDFLAKPCNPDELLMRVHRALWNLCLKRQNDRLEQRLRESEQFHRFIVDNSPSLIFALDGEGRFIYANQCFDSLLGVRSASLPGQSFLSLVRQPRRDEIEFLIREMGALKIEQKTFETELCPKHAGQHRAIPVEITLKGDDALSTIHGSGVFGVGRDLRPH